MIFSTILPFAASAFSPACWNRRNCSRMSLWSVFNSTMASVDISFLPRLFESCRWVPRKRPGHQRDALRTDDRPSPDRVPRCPPFRRRSGIRPAGRGAMLGEQRVVTGIADRPHPDVLAVRAQVFLMEPDPRGVFHAGAEHPMG